MSRVLIHFWSALNQPRVLLNYPCDELIRSGNESWIDSFTTRKESPQGFLTAVAGKESTQSVLDTWLGLLRHLDWFIYDLDINININTSITSNIRVNITSRIDVNIKVKLSTRVHEIAQSLLRHLD